MKLTQAVVDQWLESAWRDGYAKGVDGRDDLPDFASLKPEAPKPEKSSFEEISKLPFKPDKCCARILKDGWGIQCTRSFMDGCVFCKTHQKKFDGLEEGLDVPFGRFNEERPTHSKDKKEGNKIAWADTKPSKKGKTPSKSLKVGEMRDFLSTRIPNENFKGLKKADIRDLYEKEKEKMASDSSSSSSDDSGD